jgi:hypothetical protein
VPSPTSLGVKQMSGREKLICADCPNPAQAEDALRFAEENGELFICLGSQEQPVFEWDGRNSQAEELLNDPKTTPDEIDLFANLDPNSFQPIQTRTYKICSAATIKTEGN